MLPINFETHIDAQNAGWTQAAETRRNGWIFRGSIIRPGECRFSARPEADPWDSIDLPIALTETSAQVTEYHNTQSIHIAEARNRCERPEDRKGAMVDCFAQSDFDAFVEHAVASHPFLSLEGEALQEWAQGVAKSLEQRA